MNRFPYIPALVVTLAMLATAAPARQVVCRGKVEAVGGEIEVSAQKAGQLLEVRVEEGDTVTTGQVLAVIDARMEAAQVEVARAQLELAQAELGRVRAGAGDEEIREVASEEKAMATDLELARRDLARIERLSRERVVPEKELEDQQLRVRALENHLAAVRNRLAALERGALAEEVVVARMKVRAAEQELRATETYHDYRLVRAPVAGMVLRRFRHPGDVVSVHYPTPILLLADASRVRVRLEVVEHDAYRLWPGLEGAFTVNGADEPSGRLRLTHLLPVFGPRRLFEADTAARVDVRTLQALCAVIETTVPLILNQEVVATFEAGE